MSTMSIETNRAENTVGRNESSQAEPLVCFKCSTSNPFHNSFCNRCGAKLLKPMGSEVDEAKSQPAKQPQTRSELHQTGTSVDPVKAAPNTPVQPLPQDAMHSSPINVPPTTPAPNKPVQPSHQGAIHSSPKKVSSTSPVPNMSGQSSRPYSTIIPGQSGRTFTSNVPLSSVTTASSKGMTRFNMHGSNVSVVSEEDFIQKNTTYYRHKFSEMRRKNKKTSWNGAASHSGSCWFFYRKMYKMGFLFLGMELLGLIALIMPLFGALILMLAKVLSGILGNYFYMRHAEMMLVKAQNIPELQRYAYIKKKGGTSLIPAILHQGFMLCAIMVWLVTLFGAEQIYNYFLFY